MKDYHELRLAPVMAAAMLCALEEASVQWEHKKEEARQRIPQAARWIVEKVVER